MFNVHLKSYGTCRIEVERILHLLGTKEVALAGIDFACDQRHGVERRDKRRYCADAELETNFMKRKSVTTIAVTVDGRAWNRAFSLRNAGPDDAVYKLDQESGSIRFGNGIRGRTPPVGSTIGVSYRYGAGSAGNISKHIDADQDVARFWVVVSRKHQAIGWGRRSVLKRFRSGQGVGHH